MDGAKEKFARGIFATSGKYRFKIRLIDVVEKGIGY
jgi:hypothetical protein